jgi:tetratricopeptide (TPR) repeat protein
MKTEERILELETVLTKISTFRTSSATSIVLMFVGVAIIIGALLFSLLRLGPLERQADELSRQTAELTTQRDQLREELQTTKQKLENTVKQAEQARLGVMAVQARDYDRAIALFDEAIALDPTNANVYNYKGYALYRSGQATDAIDAFNACFQVDPWNVWCHYNLALAYWANGNKDLAIAEVRQTIELGPEFRDIFKKDVQFTQFKTSPEYRELIAASDEGK